MIRAIANRIFSAVFGVSAGDNGSAGGANANPSLKFSYWPNGATDATPGLTIGSHPGPGTSGFGGEGSTLFMMINGEQILWANLAQTWGLGRYDRGGIINSVNWQPGATATLLNQFRFQNSSSDGDFRTDGYFGQNVISSVGWHGSGTTTSGSAVITNLKFIPMQDKLEYVGTTLVQHSDSAGDIVAGTTITAFDATSFTMADNAINSRTDADFSINVIAPQANTTFSDDWLSYIHIPFVGTLTQGSKVVTNLKWDPTRLGIPSNATISETSNSGADIPNEVDSRGVAVPLRVGNYTQNTATLGDGNTGQPINAINSVNGVTFVILTGFSTVTFTGDLTAGDPIIRNTSVNLIAQSLPTGATGAAWDRPQWQAVSGVFASNTRVSSVTSTTITMSTNAGKTETDFAIKFESSRTNIEIGVQGDGVLQAFVGFGYYTNAGGIAVQLKNNIPWVDKSGNVLIDTTYAWKGGLKSYATPLYAADAGSTDAYSITLPNSQTTDTEGRPIVFKANTANTGNATLTINGGTTIRNIVKSVSTTLSNNDILAGMFCLVVYDATNHVYVLMNPRTL